MKRRGRLAQEIGYHNSATSCVARLAQEFGNQTATFRVAPLAQEFGNLTATTRVAPLAQEFGNQTATPCVAQLAQEFGNLTATSCVAQLAQEFGNQTASCLTQLAQVIGNQTVLDDRTAEREALGERALPRMVMRTGNVRSFTETIRRDTIRMIFKRMTMEVLKLNAPLTSSL